MKPTGPNFGLSLISILVPIALNAALGPRPKLPVKVYRTYLPNLLLCGRVRIIVLCRLSGNVVQLTLSMLTLIFVAISVMPGCKRRGMFGAARRVTDS